MLNIFVHFSFNVAYFSHYFSQLKTIVIEAHCTKKKKIYMIHKANSELSQYCCIADNSI